VLGAVIEAIAFTLRAGVLHPAVILTASFVAGMAQSALAIAAAPFLSEHSTSRERTHLFSVFFATELVASVCGDLIGGWVPSLANATAWGAAAGALVRYRVALLLGAACGLSSILAVLAMRGVAESPIRKTRAFADPAARRRILPIAVEAVLIGVGAGLVIPFMNLYFATRFACSSAQIGVFFSFAQILTACAALVGPVLARRFGALNTATAFQLLSLPFLVTLGAEKHLAVAVGAFWFRATLMQASTPLINSLVMEAMPPDLRARAASLANLLWNGGWALSATASGILIQTFGYAVPFYVTAVLYAIASLFFFFSYRGIAADLRRAQLSEEAKGLRGEGPLTE